MKRSGFTLVELLAVIVILALVALITIPVILNVVEKSKIKTYQRSIDAYGGSVNKAIAEYLLDHEDKTSKTLTYSDIQDYIKYEGNKVECTTFKIYEDKTVYLAECEVNNEEVNYTYGIKQKTICSSTDGKFSTNLGTKYECQVNSDTKYNFYVLSLNENSTVNLIMNSNICNDGTLAVKDNQCN